MSGEGDMRRHDMTRLIKESIGFVPHFFYDVTESKGFLTPEKRRRNEIWADHSAFGGSIAYFCSNSSMRGRISGCSSTPLVVCSW